MGDENKNLNILITTRAELAGAKQLEDSLERDIGKAKALGNVDEVKKLTSQLDTVRGSIKSSTVATGEAVEIGEKENISLREKRESIRALTTAFPGLREAAMFALNPITLAMFGIAGAFELFQTRVEKAQESLGTLELPDLGSDIESAKNLATAWDGVNAAVESALEKYQSSEGILGRATKAINDELKATQDLIDAEKRKALADLELQKPGMTEGAYLARKQSIESAFGEKKDAAGQLAEQEKLARKYEEFANAQITARNKLAAAAAIKLPDSDEAFAAGQAELKKRVDAYRKMAEEAGKRREELQALQVTINSEGVAGKIKSVPGAIDFGMTYGYGMTGGEAIEMQAKQERDARETADAIERGIARREKLKKQRDALRQQGSAAAGQAEALGLELPDDQRAFDFQNQNQNRSGQIGRNADRESMVAQVLEKNGGDQLASLRDLERAAGLSTQQIVAVNERIEKHLLTIPQAFSAVLQRMDIMQAQINRVIETSNLH